MLTMRIRVSLLFVSFLLSIASFAQKTYRVGNVLWEYKKPAAYKTRVDNFSSAIETGDSIIRQNNNLQEQLNDDTILFSVAENDSADLNIILGSYKGNSNITRFTLKGYADKLVEFMKANYEQLKSDVQITTTEKLIEGITFFIIENRIHHKERNFTYWTRMYIAEVSGKELNITVTYDNENDRNAIETSILSSKFHS
jgi:hypothetical protein